MEVVTRLQQLTIMGKLVRGSISTTAKHMQLHRTTVSNIWEGFKRNRRMPSGKLGRVGGKTIHTSDIVTTLVSAVPEEQRSTMRDISEATGLSMGTLSRRLRGGTIERKNTLLPLARKSLRSCRAHDSAGARASGEAGFPETPAEVTYAFDAMWDAVHLDEKWFNAENGRLKVYVVKGQSIKRRVAKSKRFIPKVMFLATVARPRHDDERGVMFDGKIGMWPGLKHLPATCNSRNHPAGTIVPTIVNVDAELYRDYVIKRDNAASHGAITEAILACVSTDGWTFVVQRQPPNSPDLNVLDLGYFVSIQSLQNKLVSRSIDDVIQSTLASFEALSSENLENVFHAVQAVMRLVLEHNGANHFPLPHLKKNAKRRAGTLLANLSCPASLLD
ncbi:hypothetical protein H257_11330 [Aphanomyces astaci]|uniref:Transposase Tc1-like domain-containing protein n=1 Tax=Aphanomyces astaci TaxID=112090 RepID=W4G4P7_APHAT|nr:hypothetical protein H257_11330 [Aphanomyces astaci]ETV74014.1 hypothetical protein H257_11330 [Aphanomyces astaci]|eukprot:XP_009836527.1 hypothetical protein H257_11330 [Aphanomyces astaci]